jgi:hypothetical protein
MHNELEDIVQNAKITIPSSSDFKENLDIKDVSVVRLLLVQQNKKMIIDLVDIPGANPMGRTDMMDSLEFMEGYFIHNRAFDKTNSGLQKRGLTKSNLNKLINAGLASKSANVFRSINMISLSSSVFIMTSPKGNTCLDSCI